LGVVQQPPEEEGDQRRKNGGARAHEDADVDEGHDDVNTMKAPFDDRARHHQTRIGSLANRSALRVPRDVVEPAQEFVEAVLIDVLSAPPIEMRIKLVDQRFVDHVRKLTDKE
jgi:hypothetical protein